MKRRHLLYVLMLTVFLGIVMGMAVAAEDASEYSEQYYFAYNLMGKDKNKPFTLFQEEEESSPFISVTSSNKKVVSVKKISKGGSWRIEAKLLKTGAADVLVKYYDSEDREDTQTEKYRIVAFKYENPFKSLKIGKKNFASKFKKGFVYDKVKAKTKGKLTFSLKKNWKAEIISTYNNTKEESWRQLKKGSKLNIAKRDEIAFNLVNKKTGARVLFILGCKSGEKPQYKFTWGSN